LFLYSNQIHFRRPLLHSAASAPPSICQLQSNPGLTCLPSCLTVKTYTKLQRDPGLRACGDELALCDFYNALTVSSRAALTNWCGPTATASSACGDGDWVGVTCLSGKVVASGREQQGPGGQPAYDDRCFGCDDILGSGYQQSVWIITISSWGYSRNCSICTLASNRLTGSIPTTLGNMLSLTSWLCSGTVCLDHYHRSSWGYSRNCRV
jgi:hypothetical protein